MQVYVWLVYHAVQQEIDNTVEQLYSKKKTHTALKLCVYVCVCVCVCGGKGVKGNKIDPRKCKIRSF